MNQVKRLLSYALLFLICLFFLPAGDETAVFAAAPYQETTTISAPAGPADTTCANPAIIVNELVRTQMVQARLPGAMVAIVQDGAVIVEEGYGRADVEREIPVRANETIFQMGSVSKLVTWTAVMQLAEAGKVDLHQDVNHYLDADLQIAPTFAQPITLAHLLAHSAGFEDRVTGIYTQDPAALDDLADFLAANMPARVRPPGEVTAYSNYGTALAAYIVQRVSGQSFARYAEENIFHPLQMSSASFRQPLPPSRRNQMATGYRLAQGDLAPAPLAYTRQIGAGGLTATAMIDAWTIIFGLPLSLQTAVSLSHATAVLGLVTALLALRAWRRRLWTFWRRLHYTVLALSGLVYIWVLSYWNLL